VFCAGALATWTVAVAPKSTFPFLPTYIFGGVGAFALYMCFATIWGWWPTTRSTPMPPTETSGLPVADHDVDSARSLPASTTTADAAADSKQQRSRSAMDRKVPTHPSMVAAKDQSGPRLVANGQGAVLSGVDSAAGRPVIVVSPKSDKPTASPGAVNTPRPIRSRNRETVEAWRLRTEGRIHAISVVGNSVYVATANSLLAIVGAEPIEDVTPLWSRTYPGKLRWSFAAGGPVRAIAADNRTVYAASYDHHVHAVDADSGRQWWSFETLGVAATVAVDPRAVFIGQRDRLNALSLNGGPFWQYAADGTVGAITTNHTTAYAGFDCRLHAVDILSGRSSWVVETGDKIKDLVVLGSTVLIGTARSVQAVQGNTGELLWTYQTGSSTAAVAAADGNVYAGTASYLCALAAACGELLWRFQTADRVTSVIADDGAVYAGTQDSYVHRLDGQTGALNWRFQAGGPVKALSVAHSLVYAGSNDRFLYAIQAATGECPIR
jgi:outer membrane protein assembly factor BamB